ncbi:poly(A) RNA polymerase, mitochondrial-like [Ostrinia furnacalis]|uniref:poly(A) RNA polymerase, mitochondrial-like n=1 Tax=Ostrinia furnacalis TaxID=93504 RepID=UPI00103A0BC3|nr:poly(A) RNA polymerase, mitochondrial-like [Ostrinia furnacalis]
MSVIFQTVINTGKVYSFNKSLRASLTSCKCLAVRKYSDVKKFTSFDDIVAQRRAEARRSLVVQVNSESSYGELYGYCSKYAEINGVHHYKNAGGEHFMLIEFGSEENLKNVIQNCSSHQKDIEVMASNSPFLWFRAAPGKKEKLSIPSKALIIKDGNAPPNEEALSEELLKCSTVSEQIQLLYDRTKLNDLGVRLRFMVARQLEVIFESLYANIAVRPFGSSVNGFGKMGCDLDLVLTNVVTKEMSDGNKRLVFQEKRCEGGRGAWQRQLELAAELLELRAAGATRVTRILHARVPIVKYAHELTGVDCDLCYSNTSGVYMSELLWALGSLDERVRPLAALVRRWAAAAGLTSAHPGRWVTSFPLTLMVLFFLQQDTGAGAVLPTVKHLVQVAGKEDIRVAEENLNCTFLRDMNKLAPERYGQSQDSLETLLLKFFEFYAQFDFQEKAISINEGTAIRKPNALPLYIVNPLEQSLNVSRNVSYEECQRLQAEVRNAAWQLEAGLEGQKSDDWGIVGLIERKASRGLKKLLRVGNSHRLVSVKDLFKDDENVESEDGLRSKLQRLTQKSETEQEDGVREMKKELESKLDRKVKNEPLKFKNRQVASEVLRIRRNKLL